MHLVVPPDPLTVPTWLTAIFTGVLAIGAIFTAAFAIAAFRKQSTEVGLLQEQARQGQQDRRREAEDRRWRQAVLVYLTTSFDSGLRQPPRTGLPLGPINVGAAAIASVHNTSGQPIYDVRVHWVDAGRFSQAGAEDELGTLGPGEDKHAQRTVPDELTAEQLVPVAYFRDAAGPRWTVLADGHLAPVDESLRPGAPEIATTAVRKSLVPPGEPATPPARRQALGQRIRAAIRLVRGRDLDE